MVSPPVSAMVSPAVMAMVSPAVMARTAIASKVSQHPTTLSWLSGSVVIHQLFQLVVHWITIFHSTQCVQLEQKHKTWGQVVFYNKMSWFVSELSENDILNVVVQCRQYSTISCRGLCLNYLKKISQTWCPVLVIFYNKLPCRFVSQTWWSSVGSIFYNKLPWFVSQILGKDISN